MLDDTKEMPTATEVPTGISVALGRNRLR